MSFLYFIYGLFFLFIFKEDIFKFFNLKRFERMLSNPMYHLCSDVLGRNFHYFKHLDNKAKDIFIYRTIKFIEEIEWKGFHEFEIKDRHKILVSACAVQLTYGYGKTEFEKLKRIFIAPNQFHSRIFNRDVKGLTMPIAIYLSWADFEEGINTNNDALNLGLHEFAHALDIQNAINPTAMDEHFNENKRLYAVLSDNVFDLMNSSNQYVGFLREYAKTNKNEFFAVAVECFFERPEFMQEKEPILYLSVCKLLNQNPLNIKMNYQLQENENLINPKFNFNSNFNLTTNKSVIIVGLGLLSIHFIFPVVNQIVSKFMFEFIFLVIACFFDARTFKLKKNSIILVLLLGFLPILILVFNFLNISIF